MTIPTTPTTRRCFCLSCTRRPAPGHWHCPYHERRIHKASEAATRRCERAKQLAASLPRTRLASELEVPQ